MIKIYIDDFYTGDRNENSKDASERISDYCHGVSTDIEIYSHDEYLFIHMWDESLTFPNIVYIENLYISVDVANLNLSFPDLTKVGELQCYGQIVNFGKLKEIDLFIDDYFEPISRKSLGDNMYRFTNKETGEQWDIKINEI